MTQFAAMLVCLLHLIVFTTLALSSFLWMRATLAWNRKCEIAIGAIALPELFPPIVFTILRISFSLRATKSIMDDARYPDTIAAFLSRKPTLPHTIPP